MNFGLPEVQQWWVDLFERLYHEWSLRWIQWDSNVSPRPMWEHGENAGNKGWNQIRCVLGLYEAADKVLEACPDLVIEQSASGGNRMEPGLLRRAHTVWMNDHVSNSHLVRTFQIGGNTFLPAIYLNTNLAQDRHDYDEMDYLSYSMGAFGISAPISTWPQSAKRKLADAIARYKRIRPMLLEDYHRPSVLPATARGPVSASFGDGRRRLTFDFHPPQAQCIEPGEKPTGT